MIESETLFAAFTQSKGIDLSNSWLGVSSRIWFVSLYCILIQALFSSDDGLFPVSLYFPFTSQKENKSQILDWLQNRDFDSKATLRTYICLLINGLSEKKILQNFLYKEAKIWQKKKNSYESSEICLHFRNMAKT